MLKRKRTLSPKAAQVPKSGDSSVNSSVNIVSPTSNALNVPAVPATVADKATCKSRTLSAHAQSARGTATGQPVPASTAAYGTPRVRAQTKRYGTLESDFKVAQAKVTKPVVKSTTRPKLASK
jgi:hypothetical protein